MVLALATATCSLTTANNFNECNADSDCASFRACAQHYCVDMPAGCTQKFGDVSAPLDSRLAIGALYPLSKGGVSDTNEALRVKALSFAVDEINAGPAPIDGRRVVVYACDDLNDNNVTAAQATWFADSLKAPALIVSRTQGTNAAYGAVAGKDVLILSPNATADELTEHYRASGGLVWRLAPPDQNQTQVLLSYINKAKPDAGSFVLVHRGGSTDAGKDPYATGIEDAFRIAAPGKVNLLPFSPDNFDPAALASSLAALGPQLTVFVAFPNELRPILDAVSRIKSLQADAGHRLMFTDSAKKPDLLLSVDGGVAPLVWELLRGAVGTAPAQRNAINPDMPNGGTCCGASYSAFRDHFLDEFQAEPDGTSFTTHSYDAVWVLRFAAASVPPGASLNGTRLKLGIERIIQTPVVENRFYLNRSGVEGALNKLYNGNFVDIEGASSAINLNFDAGFAMTPYEIWRVGTDGGFYTEKLVDP